MPKTSQNFSVRQHASDSVSDVQLYPYLVRLAVIANKQTDANNVKRQEEASSLRQDLTSDTMVVSKLPRGTVKSLMSYFKQLALDKQHEPVDPTLKRTYLAFYAQLLDLKSNQPGDLEDLGQAAELLIVKFLAIVSKVSGPASVESQGSQFVSLLRSIARKNGGTQTLDSQLAARQQKFQGIVSAKPKSPRKTVKSTDTESIAGQVARVMLVSPTLFDQDLAREQGVTLEGAAMVLQQIEQDLLVKKHPVYQSQDFSSESEWNEFASNESTQLSFLKQQLPYPLSSHRQIPDIVPGNVRTHFTLLLKRCIEADAKAPTLLGHKTQLLIKFVMQYWRVSARTHAACMLQAVNSLFSEDLIKLPDLMDAYDYLEHLVVETPGSWPLSDKLQAENSVEDLRRLVIKQLESCLGGLFSPKMPKLGPYLQIVDQTIPSLSGAWGGKQVIMPSQIRQLQKSIVEAAEHEYVRLVSQLPRDSSLDLEHILEFVQAIIRIAQKLQTKYRIPMFSQIPIARVVCTQHLKLFFSDFMPIWNFCMKQYEIKKEEPPFDLMVSVHEELVMLQDLLNQLNLDGVVTGFNPESLLFPYFQRWAIESAKLSREWVKPVIEQDNNLPIDNDNGKMYSTAVKDLFSSFHSSISLVEKQNWHDQYYVAKLLTIVVEGISSALCEWSGQVYEMFLQELKPMKAKPKLKPKDQEEQWLTYAKEATAQATAAMMAARHNQQPDTFDFKRESGVKINNIEAAYALLHGMESRLNSDDISRRIQSVERKADSKPKGASYLFTLTVISARDVKQVDGGLYVTLVDQDSRKQLGKTSTAYGNTRRPSWNEPIELEVSLNRPKLLKATLWSDNQNSSHDICGRAMIRLDPAQFARKEYGTQLKWIDLESGTGKLQVMLAIDKLQDDIRFHFGKALRFLKRTQDTMVNAVVKQFSDYIYTVLSRQTLREVTGLGSIATSVQSSVNQLQKSFNMWLGKSNVSQEKQQHIVAQEKAVDDCLEPLYDYFNKNFATLAGILTPELRIEVLSGTWDVVLEALELLIIPPLDYRRTNQTQLGSIEMEAVYAWLSSLRDFFHSEGAGPSLERLQSQSYQQIMAIPVYYDLPTTQLKIECEKVVKSSLRAVAGNQELMARQRTVMAHRNKSIIEHQAIQLHNAQRTTPQLDDVILRILRLRGEYAFIEQHLKFRERLLQREITERALQGSIF